MARINFEDRIFKDQGFQDLMIEVRSRFAAKGIVLELWSLAQEFWFPDRKPIPLDRFEAAGLPDVLLKPVTGLAEKRADGIYARGAEQAFSWLFEKAAGGEARAATAERDENGRFKPKKKRAPRKKTSANPASTSSAGGCSSSSGPASTSSHQQEPGSLLSSLNSSLSSPSSSSLGGESASPPSEPSAPPVGNELVQEFYDRWREKHGGKAPLLPKDHKRLKELGEQLGMVRARSLVGAYFKVSNAWFNTKKHDVETLMQNLTEVQAFVDRNQRARPTPATPSKVDLCAQAPAEVGAHTLTFNDVLAMVPKNLGGKAGA